MKKPCEIKYIVFLILIIYNIIDISLSFKRIQKITQEKNGYLFYFKQVELVLWVTKVR